MRGRMWFAGIVLLLVLLVTACGGGGGQQGSTTSGAAIKVSEKEWAIEVAGAAKIKAGSVKFAIKNDGTIEHNFVIKELNLRVEGIQPGQSKEVSADLKPGTYTVVCDIPGHEEAGMKITVTVSQ